MRFNHSFFPDSYLKAFKNVPNLELADYFLCGGYEKVQIIAITIPLSLLSKVLTCDKRRYAMFDG